MAARKHGGLGRGVEAFFSNPTEDTATKKKPQTTKSTSTSTKIKSSTTKTNAAKAAEPVSGGAIEGYGELRMVRLSKIEPDKSQPRKTFDKDALQELADSIKEHGLLEPLDVQAKGDRYLLVNGERRWRAAKLAGLKEVPVIIGEYDDQRRAIIGLIDNLQREDLNPIEEAQAYQRLIDEFSLKQEDVAKQVSKSRTAVTNSLRLLKLTDAVQQMVIAGSLSMGQARALLAVDDAEQQRELAERIQRENLSVREVERLIKSLGKTKARKPKAGPDASFVALYKNYEEQMSQSLGLKVDIKAKDNKSGRIELTYASQDDFEKLMDRLMK